LLPAVAGAITTVFTARPGSGAGADLEQAPSISRSGVDSSRTDEKQRFVQDAPGAN